MECILQGTEDCGIYLYDICAFSNDWDYHIKLLDEISGKLQTNGFTGNPLKCEWSIKETNWLEYCLTPEGLKHQKKKINTILKMEPPKTLKQLRRFVGVVNYYRDIWQHISHVAAPLLARLVTSPRSLFGQTR